MIVQASLRSPQSCTPCSHPLGMDLGVVSNESSVMLLHMFPQSFRDNANACIETLDMTVKTWCPTEEPSRSRSKTSRIGWLRVAHVIERGALKLEKK